ncbi:histidine kinase-, DNA gyrase B-, and HSP90-like ATPase family protein [Clostridium argentinense CDC 2741]|uniref:histidine kinase n=2 Tax=Clostridium argentinense TaxID=29341 RepID=A0A0C1R249_9CLOT|nr:histidine kinase-, DNA gyrase B-, and HSP90-like ATPase family protein [Clostridium argentinense CDC 2741]
MKDLNRKRINNFLRDKLLSIVILLCNTFFIFLFYYSTVDEIEILYPMIITIFLIIIYLVIEWYRYYRFNFQLEKFIEDSSHKVVISTYEQRDIYEVINKIHNNYIGQLEDVNIENNRKSKFLAQLIHNLKTPVTIIDLILQKQKSGKLKAEDINSLKQENMVIYDGLQNVLNLIRLDEFSKDYVPTSVDLLGTINSIIKKNKNYFIYNNVFPKIEIEEKEIFVLSDRKWNEFVIEQIIFNGIKYSASKESPKYITLKIEEEEEFVILKIVDEGIGIPDYDMDRIFEAFFTGENGRIYKNSTGIGLYMCGIVAEKLNQKITIESKVGVGTVVSIRYRRKVNVR